jgi:acyl-CoA thioesterase FadM
LETAVRGRRAAGDAIVNLYLRLLWTWLSASSKPPIRFGDVIELRLRVWPNDLDVNGHMNNGRYMTVTDLAIIEYFARAGVMKVLLNKGWRPVLGGAMISFRRSLKPWTKYALRFQMLCWDERWNYMRFEFVQSGQTMAIGHAKGAIIGAQGVVGRLDRFGAIGVSAESPSFPKSVSAWIAAEDVIRA